MYHAQDKHKQVRMMQIQKRQQSNSIGRVLSRDKAIETYKIQQDIQLDQMDKILKST